MTSKEFSTLQIGSRCYLKEQDGRYTSSEITKIDRIFGKVEVLLKSKMVSYKCIPLKLKGNQTLNGNMVGICKWNPLFKYDQ